MPVSIIVTIEAYRIATNQWESMGVIDITSMDLAKWGYFGKQERKVDVVQDGIDPKFTNHIAYPKIRFSINQVTSVPTDLSLRIHRLGHVFVVAGIEFGMYREISNPLDPFSSPSWGAFYRGIVETGGFGISSLQNATYINYEDLTSLMNTTNFTVRLRRYVPGTLGIYINGVRGIKWFAGSTNWNYKELNPAYGTFEITGFYQPGFPLTVDYYFPG